MNEEFAKIHQVLSELLRERRTRVVIGLNEVGDNGVVPQAL